MMSGGIPRRAVLRWLAGTPLVAVLPGLARAAPEAPYRDASLPIAERVRDLLSRMTLAEKVAQMTAVWGRKAELLDGVSFSPGKASANFRQGIGQVTRPSDKRGVPGIGEASGGSRDRWRTPQQTVEFVNAIQRWAVEETRLGIPVLFHEECLHGYMATDATMFPQAIALAGTFDTDLMRRINGVIAGEVRARGIPFVLSPVVDIVRDPRWGRIEETYGEEPHLVGEMGVAAVEGLQGPGKFSKLANDKVFATLKHMTGHGQPAAGNNVSPAQLPERELRDNFFPPFREIVARTSIAAVMPSYNEIDGVPSHASRWLLGEVLRDEWGFEGIIVSDYNAIEQLDTLHHVAEDLQQAARLALAAGVDCELPDGDAFLSLEQQVNEGRIDIAVIDQAVARMLELKFRGGLFEQPYGDAGLTQRITGDGNARELALEAARKSICLLSNDGTLPLTPGDDAVIAVIGPNAAIARLGGYSSVPKRTVSLLEGIRQQLDGKADVLHAQGVYITQSEDRSADEILLVDPERNRALIDEAVELAKNATVIVLAIGDTEQTSREGFAKDHLGDRTDLDLVGEQNLLFDALHALGKPIVVCAINGRPTSWPNVVARANAMLECWYPGQEGGTAMAEALFGALNPGAKLPVTVVRDVGQVPYFYNHKPSARRGYLFADKRPLFPFGHGLSYTSFDIGAPRLASAKVAAGENVVVSVDVANTGKRAGDEVVQVYVHDTLSSVARPVQLLKAFRRVTLAPGERKTLTFTLGADAFSLWDRNMQRVVERGEFRIMAGPDSANLKSTVLEIV